jgi:hypothetical protein
MIQDYIRPAGEPESGFAREAAQPSLAVGFVAAGSLESLQVLVGGVRRSAARAVSCLVEPIPDDTVLVLIQPDACHVLAVLSRTGLGDATLSLPDTSGALTVSAQSLRLAGSTRLDLAAPEVAVTTRRMHVVTDVLTQIARIASVIGETLTTAVARQTTIAHRIDVKSQDRSTTIAGLDNERLGTRVSQSDLSTASSAIVTVHARDDIRLDAKRVTIG